MRVSLVNSTGSFSVEPDQPVLEAALQAGFNLPHSCKGGNCGSCRARLLRGEVHSPNGRPLGLSDAEAAEGFVLLCQVRARTDLLIETREMKTPGEVVIKRLPSRIERVEPWAHDVLGIYLRLPAAETFRFEPGQYLDILLSGGRRRSFSIASPPHDSSLLELHVRRVSGGELTERLFAAAARGGLLSIEGPLGQFYLRPESSAPLLLVGGGTGLAPLKSIARHVIDNALAREMTLYWGVRAARDLYAHAFLLELAQRSPGFRYVPVLSEPDAAWRGRRGCVHAAVLEDFSALAAHDIYASGPPAMIAALRRDFARAGAASARLYFDSFDYAPDTLQRQRAIAPTKS